MIIILLTILVFNFLFGARSSSNILYCGIFAWNGKSANSVSKDKLKLLGIYNDDRGGHSIGMYFNNKIHKSVHPDTFKDYWKEKVFLEIINNPVIIGHSRKASVGGISIENAQPVLIKTKGSDKKEAWSKIVMAHNGTILNYKKLAEELDIDTSKLNTDSQVLAAILNIEGPKVLAKYIGAAALLYSSEKDPGVLYAFRGMSPLYSTYKNLEEERPLYYYQEHKNSIYFSSEESALISIATNKKNIHELPANILFKVKDGRLEEVEKIAREKASQKNAVATTTVHTPVNNTVGLQQSSLPKSKWELEKEEDQKRARENEDEYLRSFQGAISKGEIIYFKRGRYFRMNDPVNGEIYLNNYGYIYSRGEIERGEFSDANIAPFYFYRGILLTGKEAFEEIREAEKNNKIPPLASIEYYKYMCRYSVYPVGAMTYCTDYYKKRPYAPGYAQSTGVSFYEGFFTGSFKPLFSCLIYTFHSGNIKKIYDDETPNYPTNFSEEMDISGVYIANESDRFMYKLQALENDLADIIIDKLTKEEELEKTADVELEIGVIKDTREKLLNFVEDKISELEVAGLQSKIAKEFIDLVKEAKDTIAETELII